MSEYKYIGKNIPRIDALEKVTGQARYTADYKMPRMLHCKILRSPYPHARITRIDTSRAERLPGVRAVITAKDTPPVRWSAAIEDQYTLPTDNIVRKVDDPVAAVAAETLEAAEEALELIEVEYEELPRVTTIDEALSKKPPAVLHPDRLNYAINPPFRPTYQWHRESPEVKERPNVLNVFKIRTGDLEKGFKEADLIIENTFETVRGHHAPLEPHGNVCWVDGSGTINVLVTSQNPCMMPPQLARIYRTDSEKFRVISPWVGGGFGGKLYVREEIPIAIELAKKTGRPVKFITSRRECFLTNETRFAMRSRIKDGYKKDGTLVAREVEMLEDIGAYSNVAGLIIKNAAFGAVGTYRIPNFNLDSVGAYANLPRSSLLRGVGTPEVTWAIEQQMDMAAEKLGISPLEIRLKNLLKKGDKDVTGTEARSIGARQCLQKVAQGIRLDEKIVQKPGPWKIGRGIAIGNKYTIAGIGGTVIVKVFAEGLVEVRHNAAALGQGTNSCLAQMAAEEFGIPIERVRMVRGDTATTPYDPGSFSSRSIFHTGNALLRACEDAKRQMFAIAEPILGVPAAELETRDFKVYRKSLPSQGLSVSELFLPGGVVAKQGSELLGKGSYISPIVLDDENGHSERMCAYYAYCAYGVEVAVNVETGEVKVVRCVGAADMGQPINPVLCEVQIEGGMAMGIGLGMYEEMKFDRGIPLNPSFADYKIPTVMEIPIGDNMKAILAGDPFEEGPYGAKGLGESTLSALAPAVSNAVYRAVGVRVYKQPISRETVWRALKEKR